MMQSALLLQFSVHLQTHLQLTLFTVLRHSLLTFLVHLAMLLQLTQFTVLRLTLLLRLLLLRQRQL